MCLYHVSSSCVSLWYGCFVRDTSCLFAQRHAAMSLYCVYHVFLSCLCIRSMRKRKRERQRESVSSLSCLPCLSLVSIISLLSLSYLSCLTRHRVQQCAALRLYYMYVYHVSLSCLYIRSLFHVYHVSLLCLSYLSCLFFMSTMKERDTVDMKEAEYVTERERHSRHERSRVCH